ncbi:hypothetical protein [Rhizobium sp. AN80A]|nr:hypothetical protein [Rhizobium sp. AN80A]
MARRVVNDARPCMGMWWSVRALQINILAEIDVSNFPARKTSR